MTTDTVLDEKNKKILKILRFNGRKPVSVLAREIGLGKETTTYRINQLTKKGIIARVLPELNMSALGYSVFHIALRLRNFNKKTEKELQDYFMYSEMPVVWVGYTYGVWDMTIGVAVNNVQEFDKIMDGFLSKFGNHILNKAIGIQINSEFRPYSFLYSIDDASPKRKWQPLTKIDDVDFQILSFLFENARMSIVEIATHVKVSPDVVRYRIKKMQDEGIIKSFMTTLNRVKLGYRKYKVLLFLNSINLEEKKKIILYCRNQPNISHITTCLGSWDMEIDYDAKTPEEFNEMFAKFRDKFSDIGMDYSILLNYKYFYANPFFNMIKMNKVKK